MAERSWRIFAEMFFTFMKIGLFTIGGGWAMVPVIEREVVERHRWLKPEEFLDVLSIAVSMPGLLAVNVSIFTGYRIVKLKGALVCALGAILPSFVIILLVALFFTDIRTNEAVVAIFKGIRPAVVGLLAVPIISSSKTAKIKGWGFAVPVLVAALIAFADFSPVWVIIITGVASLVYTYYMQRKGGEKE